MAHLTTESLWHFIGYFHHQDLLNLKVPYYLGAPLYGSDGYEGDAVSLHGRFEVNWPDDAPLVGLPVEAKLISPASTGPDFLPRFSVSGPDVAFPAIRPLPTEIEPIVPPQPGGSLSSFDFEPLRITASYRIGSSQHTDIFASQQNRMFDDDVVLGDGSMFLAYGRDLENAELRALLLEAEEHVPNQVLEPFFLSSGVDREQVSNFEFDIPLSKQAGNDDVAVIDAESNGHYVNGMLTAKAPDTIDEQSATISEAISRVTEKESPEASPHLSVISESSEDGAHVEAETLFPINEIGNYIEAGGNESVNAAVISDFSESLTSRIIHGDYYETNAIVQINVLQDLDSVSRVGQAVVSTLTQQSNYVRNEASFVNDPGQLFGDFTAGVPGATDWRIDYVMGDFFDISTLIQRNYLADNDLNHLDYAEYQYSVTLGDDGQLNISQLFEFASGYDLIIIAGNYYKFNAIVQANVLLDDDMVDAGWAVLAGEADAADANGNYLLNDAAIHNIGGATFHPLSPEAEALSEAIKNQETDIDYALAIGLPGDGDDTFEVLYVTGDYYNYNLIFQTNVISDQDSLQGDVDPELGALTADKDREDTVVSDGNATVNAALIIDLDSQSDYQFLGGEAYEDTLLVQANIVTSDDPLNPQGDLHDDVVATVAALSEEANAQNDNSGNGSSSESATATSSEDIVGGILS